MKKITLITAICIMTALLTGCINVNVKAPETDDTKGQEAKTFEMDDYETEEIAEEEDLPNPLADGDLVYPGELGASDTETKQLIIKFLDETDMPPGRVTMVNVNDYEGTGEYSAFIFVYFNEYDDGVVGGKLFYVSEDMCQELEPYDNEWHSVTGIMHFGGRTYVYAVSNDSATELITYMWEVRDGKPQETCISRKGQIYQDEDGCICLVDSKSDIYYEKEDDMWTGRTWKPYYFYYDPELDDIVEYDGLSLSNEEINELVGYDVVSDIEDMGYTVDSAFLRENGIVNCTYILENEESINFKNFSFNTKTGKFLPGYDGEETFEGSDLGGIYYHCFGAENCPRTKPASIKGGRVLVTDGKTSDEPSGDTDDTTEVSHAHDGDISKAMCQELTSFIMDNNYYGFIEYDYTDVRDINLSEAFYSGAGVGDTNPSQADMKKFMKALGYTQDDIYTDCMILYKKDADALLKKLTGCGYDEMRHPLEESGWKYVKEYDAYFIQRGDTNYMPFTCVGGTRYGDEIDVTFQTDQGQGNTYKMGTWDYDVKLKVVGDSYQFVSVKVTNRKK